jgi:anti-sigma factor RsiW
MHADFQELLSLRAGEPLDAAVAQHIANCPRCGLELGRLQRLADDLSQLPHFEPPQHSWARIQEQLAQPLARRSRASWIYASAAAAAVVTVALGVLWTSTIDRDQAPAGASGSTLAQIASRDESVGQLVRRSQELEALLNRLPQRPAIEQAGTSATIDEIQSSIQMLDLQLSNGLQIDQTETERLWSTRVQLLNSLVYVRYGEVARNARPINTLDTGAI